MWCVRPGLRFSIHVSGMSATGRKRHPSPQHRDDRSDTYMASQKIEQLVIAEVEVSLNPSAMANRPGFGSGVRPNHWIPGRHYTYIGQLDFKDREWLKPGESCK